MKKLTFILSLAMVLGFTTLGNANLINNGGGIIYDTDLNITWYDAPPVLRTWQGASDWAQGLNLGGVTGWVLPMGPGPWQVIGFSNEGMMGHLYNTELGNKVGYAETGECFGLCNRGPFTNLMADMEHYWTWVATQWANVYSFEGGFYETQTVYNNYNLSLAVHEGNVGVPEPTTMLLLGLGLAGLAGVRRKFSN